MGLLDSLFRQVKSVIRQEGQKAVNEAVNQAVKDATTKTYSYTFEKLPLTAEEMKALPEAALQDPAAVASLIVIALDRYGTDRQACFDMMNFLKGPEPLSETEKQQINNQYMDGRNYTARSYFKGANPENNYTPAAPYRIEPFENPYSRENYDQGYIKIFLTSGGADSPRYVVLRQKKSTGQWFANQFIGILTGIRIPKEQDKWA
ncbi:MAG: hypothetical protein IKY02_04055 [Lachnospiraceae bacterium]|nr:hypothetical protein [Lachnospiraceae bacterium]